MTIEKLYITLAYMQKDDGDKYLCVFNPNNLMLSLATGVSVENDTVYVEVQNMLDGTPRTVSEFTRTIRYTAAENPGKKVIAKDSYSSGLICVNHTETFHPAIEKEDAETVPKESLLEESVFQDIDIVYLSCGKVVALCGNIAGEATL
jgi:hypothetical protein